MNYWERKTYNGSEMPSWAGSQELFVPDISFITSVTQPDILNLRDINLIVDWLDEMVQEEKARNYYYRGAMLYGSIADGTAVGGSDIDIMHFVDRNPHLSTFQMVGWPISYRLRGLVETCYGGRFDGNNIVELGDVQRLEMDTDRLNKYSVVLGLTEAEIALVDDVTGYRQRNAHTGNRLWKKKSQDSQMPTWQYPQDGIFPWWVNYGLLNPIS